MQQQFHLFIRHHFNGCYTASVLTHPEYAAYGPKLPALRDEIQKALAKQLATKRLETFSPTHFDNLRHRSLKLELNAVQNNRLIKVPLRFTILSRPLDPQIELFEVRIPRLHQTFNILGEDNILAWSEEIIRGHFHLKDVQTLLKYQYEKNERIESLDVTYHGPGRYKIKKTPEPSYTSGRQFQTELESVGINLTQEAKDGHLQRAYFRDEITQQLLHILGGKQGRSVLLIGPSGVGKTAVLHQAVNRIQHQEQLPPRLLGAPVWHVSGGRIIAGMKFLGQWQQRCLDIVEQIRSEFGIMYVDSLLELLMSGSVKSGLNVAQFLLPFVQSGELTLVAETTPDALTLAERINAPFIQALRKLPVPPLPLEQTFQLLQRTSQRIGKEHKVSFPPASISRALEVLARFGDADALPGSGIVLLEQMAQLQPPSRKKRTLTKQDSVKAFSRSSGFPEALIDPDELLDVAQVRDFFKQRVIGQDHAMELLTNLVMLIKASLNDPQKPLGSFLFMGPTGVGKTEASLTLAEYLFNDRKRLVRLDMSEYAYPGSAARLVDGVGSQGDLTKKVRETPFCIVLLDEIEKADPSIFDVLLQVLGEGRLTDNTGQTVRFTHTIVIMTSNLGATRKPSLGFSKQTQQNIEAHYMDAAEGFFRPEFINRIDFIVPFHDLSKPSILSIAKRMLDQAISREGFQRRNLNVQYDESILEFLLSEGFHPKYGARPMKRAVDQHVLIPLARRLIRHHQQDQQTFELYLHNQRVSFSSPQSLQGAPAPSFQSLFLQHNNLWKRFLNQSRQRLEQWQGSTLHRQLQQDENPLTTELAACFQELHDLEEASTQSPSTLPQDTQQHLQTRAEAITQRIHTLEWQLCLHTLPSRSSITLFFSAPSLHPASLKLLDTLVEQYTLWASTHSLSHTLEESPDHTQIHFSGPNAETLFIGEIGKHTLLLEDEESTTITLTHQPHTPANPEPNTAREYSSSPPTIWDPNTETERSCTPQQLAQHLDAFALAHMCQRVAKL